MKIKGAELFVKALKEEGVDKLFGYPGGYAIDLFDALYDQEDIEIILMRHEQALAHAADGYARSTGKVGVCLVTSGPGATNLVTGIATANYDSVPMVCFTGQVPTNLIGNDAFQEVDMVGITRNICKYAVAVRKREDLGEIIKKAFYIAKSGKPGVVVVDLPKDVQIALGDDTYPDEINIRGYKPSTGVHIGQLKKAMKLLNKAKKPLFLVGGGVKTAHAQEQLRHVVEVTGVPVITTIMGKGSLPTDHPLYIGNIGLHGNYASNHAVSECDVLFSIGTRFNDRITGKLSEFAKNAAIIHVDIDPASISRNIVVDIPIVSDAKTALEAMGEHVKPLKCREWVEKVESWKNKYPIQMKQGERMNAQNIISKMNQMFDKSITVTDVGQNQLWTTQFLEMTEGKQLLTSGGLGTMGYGLPASIGAQLGNPDKKVICIAGDGGAQMNIQELASAVTLELPIIFCIFNNSYLGNVRQWQEMFYKKRYSTTCLRHHRSCGNHCENAKVCCEKFKYTPDFVKLAESYGALGIRVEKAEDIEGALKKAGEQKNTPAVIEFILDPNDIVMPMVPGGNSLSDMIMEW